MALKLRSSGSEKDGENQLLGRNLLNLHSSKDIVQAVKDCIASGKTDRVKKYDQTYKREKKGRDN